MVIRIRRGAVERVLAGGAVGEFVQVVLAQANRSGRVHGANRVRIGLRDIVVQEFRAGGGGKTGDVEKVLAGVGYCV